MKRLISVLLCVMMIVTALPLMISNAEGTENPFTDVKAGKWYTEAVLWCYENGYMAGVSETEFGVNSAVTREMFVTLLAKIDGADLSVYAKDTEGLPFTDIKAGYYIRALKWAYENKYTSGVSATEFGTGKPVTREQLAAFLRTYAAAKGVDVSATVDLSTYADGSSVSKYARAAMGWAVASGMISGTGNNMLSPKQDATRAQIALIVKNFVENALDTDIVFTIDGNDISLYRVVIPQAAVKKSDLEYLLETAQAFVRFVRDGFGVELPIVYDTEDPVDYEIVIGRTAREDAGLVTVEVEDEFDIGYKVNVQGTRLVIAAEVDGDMRRGAQYGMYDFCEDALGYHFYTDDLILRDNKSAKIRADYVLTGEPAFKDRVVYLTGGWDDVYYNDEYYTTASLTHELPRWIDPSLGYSDATPCLTDEANIQKVITYIRNKLAKKYQDTIFLCCGDNENGYCTCADCRAVYKEEGTTAGTLVRLANRVCEDLREDYPDFKVKLMAYLFTADPPRKSTLDDHIIVYYCPIHACASHAFSDPDCKINKNVRKQAEGWAALASEFYVWDYSVNFSYLLCPTANFSNLLENARYIYDIGARGVFNNGVSSRTGEFCELRSYLLTRIYRDPHMTADKYNKLMNDWLCAYYGPGWQNIREFIDLMDEYSEANNFIYSARPTAIYEYDKIADNASYIRSLWDKAAASAVTDAQKANVRRSRLCCDFILQCALFDPMVTRGTDATKQQYYNANQALYDEIRAIGVRWNEDVSETPFNIYQSPENW